jgi:ABC-type glycerol-3-phosphate transport system substrate-binding protein
LVKNGKGKTSTIFGGSLATYAISARSRHREEAIEFLRSLTDRLAARDIIYDMGDIPALKHIPYKDYPSPFHARMAEELNKAEKVQVHYFKYLSPQPAGIYLNTVSKLFGKEIAPEEAFKTVEEALAATSENNVLLSRGVSNEEG